MICCALLGWISFSPTFGFYILGLSFPDYCLKNAYDTIGFYFVKETILKVKVRTTSTIHRREHGGMCMYVYMYSHIHDFTPYQQTRTTTKNNIIESITLDYIFPNVYGIVLKEYFNVFSV